MGVKTKSERKQTKVGRTGRAGLWWAGSVLGILLLATLSWFALRGRFAASVPETEAVSARGSGPSAPDFTVPTLDGGTFTLSEQQGKPVVLFIMAYWCRTCVQEAQALDELHRQYGDRVSIIALDVDPSSTPEGLQTFREWVGEAGYVWAFDKDNRVVQAYSVRRLDTTFIINQAGEIVYTDVSPTSYLSLDKSGRHKESEMNVNISELQKSYMLQSDLPHPDDFPKVRRACAGRRTHGKYERRQF